MSEEQPQPAPGHASHDSSGSSIDIAEIERNGATRVYQARVSSDRVRELAAARLESRAKTIRFPEFRPGKIPLAVMEQRFGAAARAVDRIFSTGGLASAIEISSGAVAGAADRVERGTRGGGSDGSSSRRNFRRPSSATGAGLSGFRQRVHGGAPIDRTRVSGDLGGGRIRNA